MGETGARSKLTKIYTRPKLELPNIDGPLFWKEAIRFFKEMKRTRKMAPSYTRAV
jgi:hypothetical protein